MSSDFVKNYYFLVELGKNMYFNNKSMIILSFFIFSWKFPNFSLKVIILGQLLPKIPDRDTSTITPNVLISKLLLYIYHSMKN